MDDCCCSLCETELQCKNRSQRLLGGRRQRSLVVTNVFAVQFKIKWKNKKRLLLLFIETLSKRRKVDTECRVAQEEQSSSRLSTCVFGVFTFQCSRNKIFISTVRQSWWTVQERVSTADYREDKWGAGRFEETTVSFYSAVKAGYLMEVK